jgi:hypothetical protein
MAQQTKADRSAAAKKAAATRQREAQRERSQTAGTKAASTRQARDAGHAADQAGRTARGIVTGAVNGAKTVARLSGVAAVEAGKAVATRARLNREQR